MYTNPSLPQALWRDLQDALAAFNPALQQHIRELSPSHPPTPSPEPTQETSDLEDQRKTIKPPQHATQLYSSTDAENNQQTLSSTDSSAALAAAAVRGSGTYRNPLGAAKVDEGMKI